MARRVGEVKAANRSAPPPGGLKTTASRGQPTTSVAAYATLPLVVMRSAALSGNAKVVFAALLNYQRLGRIVPKQKTLQTETGLGRDALFRALGELRALGVVEWERGRYFNTYTVSGDFHRVLLQMRENQTSGGAKTRHLRKSHHYSLEKNNRKGEAAAKTTSSV